MELQHRSIDLLIANFDVMLARDLHLAVAKDSLHREIVATKFEQIGGDPATETTCSLGPEGKPIPDTPIFAGIRQERADLDKLALRVVLYSFGMTGTGAALLGVFGGFDLPVTRSMLRETRISVPS